MRTKSLKQHGNTNKFLKGVSLRRLSCLPNPSINNSWFCMLDLLRSFKVIDYATINYIGCTDVILKESLATTRSLRD